VIEYECKECGRIYEDPRQKTCCGDFLKSADLEDSPVVWSSKKN